MSSHARHWLAAAADVAPDRVALVANDATLTFSQLAERAGSVAAHLAERGVGRGDRVAVWLDNDPVYVELLFAALALGASLVPLNRRLGPHELAPLLTSAAPRLVVSDDPAPFPDYPTAPRRALTGANAAPSALSDLSRDAEVALLFTSGTTGQPSGVPLRVRHFAASAAASAERLGCESHDRWLVCMPLYHVGGLSIPIRSAIGATAVALHTDFDAARVARALEHEGVTVVSLVPTMLERILESGALATCPDRLRLILLGGGPIPAPLLARCRERDLPVAPTYGLTEATSQVATLHPDEARRAPNAAGRAVAGTGIRIVDPDGRALPPGEVGEICVRGPQVMDGYLDPPEGRASALRHGWLHTGDAGSLDADGYLYVSDRRDDLIVSGGENVYPAEVEAVLAAHPRVVEVGVIGLADKTWGQTVHAVVVASASETALRTWLENRLARFKQPRSYDFVDRLPRTASGKLRRSELRERYVSPPDQRAAAPASRAAVTNTPSRRPQSEIVSDGKS